MNILLTPEQIADFNEEFWREHTSNQSGDAEAEYDRELCRAQVRNVAKWMEQEGVVVHERQLGFVLPFQSWAALKAAGGEG